MPKVWCIARACFPGGKGFQCVAFLGDCELPCAAANRCRRKSVGPECCQFGPRKDAHRQNKADGTIQGTVLLRRQEKALRGFFAAIRQKELSRCLSYKSS